METQNNKQQRTDQEKLWYENNPWIKRNHFLMKWPFYNLARLELAYKHARENTRKIILNYLESIYCDKEKNFVKKALVAPCGTSADQDILYNIAESYFGIDISPEALKECPRNIITKEADILENGYIDDEFDFVASFLFFHHVSKLGYEPFLKEFNRILKKNGILVILEPSSLYPLSFLMNLGRKLFGNISGLVPDEAPINPSKLSLSIEKSGFKIRKLHSVSFSHNRIPLPFQYLINILSKPLQGLPPFNRMGWLCLWVCEKIN